MNPKYTKEEILNVELGNFHYQFNRIYDSLYENDCLLEDVLDYYGVTDKLIEKAENYLQSEEWKEFIKAYSQKYHDMFISDRELEAFAIARGIY